jgi:hypothetical protein
MDVHPKGRYLHVAAVTINVLTVYVYGDDGRLRFLNAVPNSGKGLCWVRVNREGTRLYTSNTGDSSISVYDLSKPAKPVEIQKVTLKGPGVNYQIGLDKEARLLYAITQRDSTAKPSESNALHVLAVDADGRVEEVDTSPTVFPFTDGTRPQGVAVH